MRGLRGWPNISAIETEMPGMIKVIDDAFDDMDARYRGIEEDRVREDSLQRIMLVISDYPLFLALTSDLWRERRNDVPGPQSAEHPVMEKLRALLVLARGAKMNLFAASSVCVTDLIPGNIRDQFGGRIALGRQTAEAARLMFGDAGVGRDIPLGAWGVGTAATASGGVGAAVTASGPKRVTAGWLPDPLDYPGGFNPADGDAGHQKSLLLSMLPDGAIWRGPVLMPLADA